MMGLHIGYQRQMAYMADQTDQVSTEIQFRILSIPELQAERGNLFPDN